MTAGHALITGCARGIGQAMARHFLALGWQVTGVDVLPCTSQETGGADGAVGFAHHVCDITDEAALSAVVDAASTRAPLTAVMCNAAVTDPLHAAAIDLDYARWQRIQRVNVDGSFLTARLCARRMTRGGNIVFVTSSLAFFSQARASDAPYCTSKSAVEMLMRVLALELAPRGINVNSLFPSVMIDTGFFDHLSPAERHALATPDILNRTAALLAALPPGTLTGTSLDQQRWDDDAAYRASIAGAAAGPPVDAHQGATP